MRGELGGAFLFALGACSLVVDTDGLSSGGIGGGGRGPIADAATDTDAVGSNSDAGTGADGATRPCADGTHFLCADFDQGDVGTGWSGTYLTDGTVDLATDFVSPPRSFRAITRPSGSGEKSARLKREFPATPKRAHLSMQLFMCETSSLFEIVKFEEGGGDYGGINLTANVGGGDVVAADVGGIETLHSLGQRIPVGRWVHVTMDVRFDAAAGEVKVVFDDAATPTLDKTGIRTLGNSAIGRIVVGLWTPSPTACTALFDDIVLDLEM
jgi:hypothetical protein